MRRLTLIAPLGALTLAACGSPEPAAGNLDADNLAVNALVAKDAAVVNDVADVSEAAQEAPATPAPAPKAAPKPAPVPPAPKPAPKSPAPAPAPAPDSACAPEHRAAGHC